MGIFQCCKTKKRVKGKKKEEDINRPRGVYYFQKDGLKKEQEMTGQDALLTLGFEAESSYVRYIGVFDGHGERGKEASNYVASYSSSFIINSRNTIRKWITREICTEKFTDLYKRIQRATQKNKEMYELSGTCAVSVLVIDKLCFVVNLGDSRAVIGSKSGETKHAVQMSVDHKPNNIEEQERIIKMGGEVSNDRDGGGGPYRVYRNNGDLAPGLAISRSLGDLMAHECGVSEIPQISYKNIDTNDEFIVIGSDGIFDVMNSVEIVGYIFERVDEVGKDRIAEEVVEECRKRWNVINKFKEDAQYDRIMSDSTISAADKLRYQNQYNIMKQNQASMNTTTSGSSAPVKQNQSYTSSIDDITCVILFFRY